MADQHTNDKALEGLSDSQRQSLHEFSQVTNANLDLAVRVLASRQWNTQQAIQMYYEPGYADGLQKSDSAQEAVKDDVGEGLRRRGGEPSGRGRDTQSNGPSESGSGHNAEGSRRKPEDSASKRPQFAITPLLVWPFVLMLRLAMLAAATLLRMLGIRRIASAGVPNQTTLTDNFEHHFEAHYGLDHPPFFHGTLADAQTAALRDQKYIVLVLWSKEHDDADVFGRALAHPDVVACLTHERFIVWPGDLTQSDAYAAASDSGATHFPSISVLGPCAQSTGQPRLELLARMRNGPQTTSAMAQSLVSFITRVVTSRDSIMRAMRREQEEREAERRLRAQQNAAYEASLARDRERDREQREQNARAKEEEEKAREQQVKEREERDKEERRMREEQVLDGQRTQWRWAKLAQIHSESATELANTDTAKLSLRLENGSRIVHSFARDSTMQHVFDFVETRGVADEWAALGVTPYGTDLAQITAPAGYTHTYEFALVSQFPRVVFDDRRATLHTALSACGLWPSAVLIAEPLFEPED
ncbi:Ubx domain-containing protein [Coemansia sp. RSA 1972]|nr:Ubx domain-containing protein [Coemansia sp. RSA 1972]